jgi:hypothetical protein
MPGGWLKDRSVAQLADRCTANGRWLARPCVCSGAAGSGYRHSRFLLATLASAADPPSALLLNIFHMLCGHIGWSLKIGLPELVDRSVSTVPLAPGPVNNLS